jgi:hypothetical protein
MERVLLEIGFLHRNNPQRMMRVLRRILARADLDEGEVRALRGVFRQMDWYAGKSGGKGLSSSTWTGSMGIKNSHRHRASSLSNFGKKSGAKKEK